MSAIDPNKAIYAGIGTITPNIIVLIITANISSSKIFPNEYNVFRKDRQVEEYL